MTDDPIRDTLTEAFNEFVKSQPPGVLVCRQIVTVLDDDGRVRWSGEVEARHHGSDEAGTPVVSLSGPVEYHEVMNELVAEVG